jgi:PAS domain S-box-containing protein
MNTEKCVLLVAAQPAALAQRFTGRLARTGCVALLAEGCPEARERLAKSLVSVLAVDLDLPGVLDLIDLAKERPHTVVLALASGGTPAPTIIDAFRRGARDCLPKEPPDTPVEDRLPGAVVTALADAALSREHARNSVIMEHTDEGSFIAREGALIYANRALARLLGRPRHELAGMKFAEAVAHLSPERCTAIEAALRGEAAFGPEEIPLLQPDGGTRPALLRIKQADFEGAPAAVGLCRDARARKELAGKLSQAERLAAMGGMISGIAHELNNKLAPVVACAELLEGSQLGLKDRQRVQMIAGSAAEAKRIVEGLLNFARQETPRRKPVDLNAVAEHVLALPTYRFKQWKVELVRDLAPGIPATMADPDQLERVLMNLVNNACQAMEETGGRLRVATKRQRGQLAIEVEDSGPGITPKNLPRIFDPFFSTKSLGKGTGLGLSLCHGIVKQHGGEIEVESEAGRTLFRVRLPHVPPTGAEQEARRPAPLLKRRLSGRLLLVDDEDNILKVLSDALADSFEIVCAANGREAVGRLAKDPFDAVVTDIKMPVMDGMQLYGWIESHQPGLAGRVIFTTGNTIDAETRAFLQGHHNPYLTKPFNLSRLLATLEHVLD